MLSNNWPSLRKLGIGYFLDSVEIWVTPIPKDSISDEEILYKLKDSWPQRSNKDIDISEAHDVIINLGGQINGEINKIEVSMEIITNSWRNRISNAELIQLCSKMVHTLEITFNSLLNLDRLKSAEGGNSYGRLNKLEDGNSNEQNITAKAADRNCPEIFQSFSVYAYLQTNVDRKPNDTNGNLKLNIDLSECRMGQMLSDNWPSLRKLGIGYFLDSVEIWVTPIPKESISDEETLYQLKDSWPKRSNKDIDIPEAHEVIVNLGGQINGEIWKIGGQLNGNYEHSCHWDIYEEMYGFRISIEQILSCKINGRRFISNKESKLIKLCPKMVHTLEITFDSLVDFNKNFENFEMPKGSRPNVIFGENVTPKKEIIQRDLNSNIEIKKEDQ
ncbi:8578_t:CDS:2 [Diversispora eburnea]|uniref:8578_t:CDS:1 n=1 Tax=Diversispora eburnea TaxID=1213867 RepID=A0A9N8UZG6_9GLOM|nr:8578_t:CDS:2 [Diversispora eburnea]